jgi:hypothetical protein
MWHKKSQQISRSQAINLEPRLSLDSFDGQHAISKANDSERWLWCVIDLLIDMPKLAFASLIRSVRRRIGERRARSCKDQH